MKDIKGYEGLYAVTSCGKVWSYRNKKFLKPRKKNKGYLAVALCKDGTQKNYTIHRLVAEAYLPNPNNLPQVNHKDENKTHNYINNLEWISGIDNMNYGTRNERAGKAISEAKKKPVICVETGVIYPSVMEAGLLTGIAKTTISAVCRKVPHQITAGGYHWEFYEKKEGNNNG